MWHSERTGAGLSQRPAKVKAVLEAGERRGDLTSDPVRPGEGCHTDRSATRLQPLRQKAPWLEPGDEWRAHLPVSCLEVRRVRQHRANCILFGRSVVKRSHG